MSDRPTPPDPDPGPERPDQGPQTAADDTAALPQEAAHAGTPSAAQGAPGPEATTGPSAGHPAPGAYAAPGAPVATATAAVPGGPRRWWGEATSTAGGRGALVVAGVLGLVVLFAGALLAGGLVLRAVGGGHHDRAALLDHRGPFSDQWGEGRGRPGDWPGERRDGGGTKGEQERGGGPRTGPGDGRGAGRVLGGLGGDLLHGEFTASVAGTPTVMVVQTGEVTAYTSGRSLGVRSSDGFEATYSLDQSVARMRGAADLATGVQVRVVAVKEGMRLTRLVVVG